MATSLNQKDESTYLDPLEPRRCRSEQSSTKTVLLLVWCGQLVRKHVANCSIRGMRGCGKRFAQSRSASRASMPALDWRVGAIIRATGGSCPPSTPDNGGLCRHRGVLDKCCFKRLAMAVPRMWGVGTNTDHFKIAVLTASRAAEQFLEWYNLQAGKRHMCSEKDCVKRDSGCRASTT